MPCSKRSTRGTHTVLSSLGYNLNSNIENLILTGTANINGTGNSLNNVLTGNKRLEYYGRRVWPRCLIR